jgi:hypothetical protein
MKLLAIAGRKQSGKDSLGNFLVRNHLELFTDVLDVKKVGWGDSLKRMVGDLFDVPDEWLWGTDKDKDNLTKVKWCDLPHWKELKNVGDGKAHGYTDFLTVRELLQHFATEIVRKMNPDAWVNIAVKEVQRHNYDLAVFIDTRFPNEVDKIHSLGGKVIRLTRKEDVPAVHESEYLLDRENYDWSNFDAVIDNKLMTLTEQENELSKLLEVWGWK